MTNLPTTTQWSNVSLSNTNRAILTPSDSSSTKGGVLPENFSYDGYAARLLTFQEIGAACGGDGNPTSQGELNSCIYLMENTKFSSNSLGTYGYWLESSGEGSTNYAYNILVSSRNINSSQVNSSSSYAVRPAIEVLKTDIQF